jgi:hypothetical protein
MSLVGKLKLRISDNNRMAKLKMVIPLIKGNDTILDIGVDPSIAGNTNYFEKWFAGGNPVTCLGLHGDYSLFKSSLPNRKLIEFDGIHFPTFDEKFDFAFSNAVIEHVGNHARQVQWLSCIRDMTKLLFITTPNRWLPFETHSETFFFHWFPDRIRNFFYRIIGKKLFSRNYMWLLGEKDFKEIIEEAGFDIITFHKNRFLFFPIDFVAVCKPRERNIP